MQAGVHAVARTNVVEEGIDSLPFGEGSKAFRHPLLLGIDRLIGADLLGELQFAGRKIDGDDPAARQTRQLHGVAAQPPDPHHGNILAEADLRFRLDRMRGRGDGIRKAAGFLERNPIRDLEGIPGGYLDVLGIGPRQFVPNPPRLEAPILLSRRAVGA